VSGLALVTPEVWIAAYSIPRAEDFVEILAADCIANVVAQVVYAFCAGGHAAFVCHSRRDAACACYKK